MMKHRVIGDVQPGYVIRVESETLLPKRQGNRASFPAAVELGDSSRQLMLPLVTQGERQPATFGGKCPV
jgi:hypothetical protein